jgi:hypothetical protein
MYCTLSLIFFIDFRSQTGETEMSDDDPQISYMISAWARICKILGSGFAPYLPLVMGPVMKTASMKPGTYNKISNQHYVGF